MEQLKNKSKLKKSLHRSQVSQTSEGNFAAPTPSQVRAEPPSQPSPLARRLLWSFGFVITTTISATIGATLALITPLSPVVVPNAPEKPVASERWMKGFYYRLSRPVNILVMGIDQVLDAPANSPDVFTGRSDTMLLLRLDPKANGVSMLSIPRDTQVDIPGVGAEKINYANEHGGPALAARVVSRTLNDVPVDRYVRVNTDAFQELVDLLGGVEVFVPQAMSYVDYTQNLKIDLAPGWQTLNGDQAEQFARFRNDGFGDIGRVQRQQALIKALRNRLTSPAVLPRLPRIVRVMRKYVDTNLSLEEMLALVGFGLKLDQDDLKMVMLPGRFSAPEEYVASYWIMDPEGRDRIMEQYFQQAAIASEFEQVGGTDRELSSLRIAVQNASGQPEIAREVAKHLSNQGFYNVYVVDDWPDHLRQTQIIVQQGDLQGASELHKALGLGKIEAASVGDLDSDLTIRIGEDWNNSHATAIFSPHKTF